MHETGTGMVPGDHLTLMVDFPVETSQVSYEWLRPRLANNPGLQGRRPISDRRGRTSASAIAARCRRPF
jgi:hypothetical protein